MPSIHSTDDALVIRKRRLVLRLIAFVMLIVSIVAANSPKKPDGPILAVAFGITTLLLLWGSETVTVDLQRSTDRFSIRYGGLFGMLARETTRPLSSLKGAEVDRGVTGRSGSRVAFVFSSGERLPLTNAYVTGEAADNRRIVDAINAFMHPKKEHGAAAFERVQSSGSDIQNALQKLIELGGDGFAIIDAGDDNEFVQFSVESKGLELCWPTSGAPIGEHADRAIELLRALGFRSVPDPEARGALAAMDAGMYAAAEDGVYAQFGTDVARAEQFALDAFTNIFGQRDARLHVTLQD